MTRLLVSRALGGFLALLALAALWNAVNDVRSAATPAQYASVGLLLVASAAGLIAGNWLWRRDSRAPLGTAITVLLATCAGTLAAWSYAPAGAERRSAALGAGLGGLALAVILTLLARAAVKRDWHRRSA
ncbi:MAG: hypothetical protein ACT4R6_06515 [Gemmatimonadaceae bacterium]